MNEKIKVKMQNLPTVTEIDIRELEKDLKQLVDMDVSSSDEPLHLLHIVDKERQLDIAKLTMAIQELKYLLDRKSS